MDRYIYIHGTRTPERYNYTTHTRPWPSHAAFRSFGFKTCIEEACKVIRCARVEAVSALNGICIVKLMGRDSGLGFGGFFFCGSLRSFPTSCLFRA